MMVTPEQGWQWFKEDFKNWRAGKKTQRQIPPQGTRYRTMGLLKTMILIMILIAVIIMGLQMATYGWLRWW